jgi:tRNA-specific 2-thiouridylase
VVGVSGGVDSAVALKRLRDDGVPVRAVFMKNWEEDDRDGRCAAAQDLADAKAVCEALGVALGTVNLAHEYWEHVFQHFLDECRRGRTPNPDVLCNREVKFRAFLDHARSLGAESIATGHYARRMRRDGRWRLLRARDEDKDQTYFLHRLDQEQLAAARFPLGNLDKGQVRGLARAAGLAVHAKKDSTGICFIGERHFAGFLSRFLPSDPGPMVSVEGTCLGEHRGLAFYTVGQRQGLGIGGRGGGSGEPWYVAGKDTASNTLLVAQGRRHPALYAAALRTEPPHWIAGESPRLPLACHARLRHRQALQPCSVEAAASAGLRVRFDQPQWAVTPGQSVVLYAGDACLGGAVIEAPCA